MRASWRCWSCAPTPCAWACTATRSRFNRHDMTNGEDVMKRIGWLALCMMTLTWQAASAAEPFQVGKDYYALPIPQPVETGAKIELREFFWYGCPHCYALEPMLVA